MPNSPQTQTAERPKTQVGVTKLEQLSSLDLAQALAARFKIGPDEWHRLKSDRQARAKEQTIAALVFLIERKPEEALLRLQQAAGWLDRSISAPPCPTHGQTKGQPKESLP